MALGCNSSTYCHDGERIDATEDYAKLARPRLLPSLHTGHCPSASRHSFPNSKPHDSGMGAKRLKNYLQVLTMELTTLARACGKSKCITWNAKTWLL